MSKLHITIPKITINKKWLYIGAGTLLILAVLAVGIVAQNRKERVEAAEAAHQAQLAKDTVTNLESRLTAAEKEAARHKQAKDAVCDWVRGVQAQRRQTVPPLCRISNI